MIPSKKKKVHQRVHHYMLSTTPRGFIRTHSGDTQTTYAGISNAKVGLVMHSVSTGKST